MKNTVVMVITVVSISTGALAKDASIKSRSVGKSVKIVNAQSESVLGPSETFTGKVRVTTVLTADDSDSVSCASVAFEAGARSAWHSHPKGQLLVVTEGTGLIQAEGQPVRRIKAGDTIWTPPNVKHWHGASPNSAMVHTATQEIVNGSPVNWMQKVTDEEYRSTPQ